ncbi:MarR family transcriptional regulator [Nesterenkonia halophila]|uniref:MarR family winged helix-turn-helix transcriptional regulator n=1 Tax=Nesterenkonia halophila TaxID=302044 RepID=UPI001FEA9FFA|nr:MarR family transcriptional regulator [Nesterenkonia halophila]
MPDRSAPDRDEPRMVDPRVMDPEGALAPHAGIAAEEMDQIVGVLESLRRWHLAERRMNEASQAAMRLGETDMRALRFIIAAQRDERLATPGGLARHLDISTASVTKLLDRLAAQDHIRRLPHPEDRRSTAIEVVEETRRAARRAVGGPHADRFRAVAELTPEERDVVRSFLDRLASTEPPDGT